MLGSSMVPSTREWLARICSTRVEPERGSPTMKIGAGSGSPLPARRQRMQGRKTRECAPCGVRNSRYRRAHRGAAERCRGHSEQRRRHTVDAAHRPFRGRNAAAPYWSGRSCRCPAGFAWPDLGIAEGVILEVGQAPVCIRNFRVHGQRRLVSGLALVAPAERLMNVADGHSQPNFLGLKPRRPFVGLERLFVAHEPRRHGCERDPALRVLGLNLEQSARSGRRLLEASERRERLPKSRHARGWCADCFKAWRSSRSASYPCRPPERLPQDRTMPPRDWHLPAGCRE